MITEHTIEENILLKSLEKKRLADSIMEEGKFSLDYYKKLNVRDLLGELIMPGFKQTDLSQIVLSQFFYNNILRISSNLNKLLIQ